MLYYISAIKANRISIELFKETSSDNRTFLFSPPVTLKGRADIDERVYYPDAGKKGDFEELHQWRIIEHLDEFIGRADGEVLLLRGHRDREYFPIEALFPYHPAARWIYYAEASLAAGADTNTFARYFLSLSFYVHRYI